MDVRAENLGFSAERGVAMRSLAVFISLLSLIFLSCNGVIADTGVDPGEDSAANEVIDVDEIQAVKAVMDEYERLSNEGDFEAWMTLWAKDAIRLPSYASMAKGIQSIASQAGIVFRAYHIELRIPKIEEVSLHGDIAVAVCQYRARLRNKASGEVIELEKDGKSLTVLRKNSRGQWKILYDAFNTNLPRQR